MESTPTPEASRRSVLRSSALGIGTIMAGASIAGAQSAAAAAPVANPGSPGRFLTLDQIPGDSPAKGHQNTIEVVQASWQASAPLDRALGSGKPTFGNLQLTVRTSTATPLLMQALINEASIAKGTLDVVKSVGGSATEVLRYLMENIRVLSLTTQESSTGDLLDDVELAAERVTLSVWNATASVDVKWDQLKGIVVPVIS